MTYEMAWVSGTSAGQSATVAYGVNTGSIAGLTATFSMSALAARVHPPQPPGNKSGVSYFLLFALIAGVAAFLALSAGNKEAGVVFLLMALLLWIAGYLMLRSEKQETKKNNKAYLTSLAVWHNSMICLRCGNDWIRKAGERLPSSFH